VGFSSLIETDQRGLPVLEQDMWVRLATMKRTRDFHVAPFGQAEQEKGTVN